MVHLWEGLRAERARNPKFDPNFESAFPFPLLPLTVSPAATPSLVATRQPPAPPPPAPRCLLPVPAEANQWGRGLAGVRCRAPEPRVDRGVRHDA